MTKIRKKIEILVDAPLLRRIRDLAEECDVSGYTVLPTLGGGGRQGRWLDDQVTGGAGTKVVFATVVGDRGADRFLTAVKPLIGEYGLMVTVYDVEVLRDNGD